MLIPKEDSEGRLIGYTPIFIPQDVTRLADRRQLPEKLITYATKAYIIHVRELLHTHNQSNCIIVIPNDEIYDFYFRGLHLHFAFAYNKGFYKIRERWPLVFETPSTPTDHIIKKTIKFWAHVSQLEEKKKMSGEPKEAPIPEFTPTEKKKPEFPILRFFRYSHLPNHLRDASKPFCDLAETVANMATPGGENAEIAAGLRKLLEAKDCIVRAMLNRIP